MKYISAFLLSLLLLSSCKDHNQEKELNERWNTLRQREDSLAEKEKALSMKESELAMREQQLDSAMHYTDTAGVYNPYLAGNWKVNMRCTETTCPGSAIGDVKNEQWDIKYQGYDVLAHVVKDNKLIRTYSGRFKNNMLTLSVIKAKEGDAEVNAELTLTDGQRLEGKREIVKSDGCKITYSIQAEKQQ